MDFVRIHSSGRGIEFPIPVTSVAIRTAKSMEDGADLKRGIIEEPVSLVHHQTAVAARRRSMSKSPPQIVSPKQTSFS